MRRIRAFFMPRRYAYMAVRSPRDEVVMASSVLSNRLEQRVVAHRFFMPKKMMYNKKMNLTAEMILAEKDIAVIRNWKIELEKEINEFETRTSQYEKLSKGQLMSYRSMKGMWRLCRSRIGEYTLQLKEQGVWQSERSRKSQRHLASVFMEMAKRELPKDVYISILEKAQVKIDEG